MDPDSLVTAPVETRIILRCEGGYVGTVINNRWFERPCSQKRCRREGVQVFHIWDLWTGRKRTVERPIQPQDG